MGKVAGAVDLSFMFPERDDRGKKHHAKNDNRSYEHNNEKLDQSEASDLFFHDWFSMFCEDGMKDDATRMKPDPVVPKK